MIDSKIDENYYEGMKIIPSFSYERKVVNFNNLIKAYQNARKLKRTRHEVMFFNANLEDYILKLYKELKYRCYKIGPYRKFCVMEPKLRLISALHFRDRIVQWVLYQFLYPFFDKIFINDSYACRKNKGTFKALERIEYWLRKLHHLSKVQNKKFYYLKLDISKFFYRINHKVLMSILRRRIHDKKILHLLRMIVSNREARFGLPRFKEPKDVKPEDWRYDCGMPIGNLTSQLFANIYMNEVDQFCKHELKLKYYIRYMDDMIILGEKERLKEVEPIIKEFLLEKLKLDTNNKTILAPITKEIEFVGFYIDGYRRSIRKSTSKRMKKYIKHLIREYDNDNIDLQDLKSPLISYKGIFERSSSKKLRNTIFNIIYSSKRLKEPLSFLTSIFPDI